MKKLLSILLILCLLAPSAMAGWEDEPFHSVQSVVNSDNIKKNYKDFYSKGAFTTIIPGLAEDFIPQGMAHYAAKDLIFLSGYSSYGLPCSLIAVDRKTNQIVKQIFLAYENGADFDGHAGGVCVTDKNIFISDDNYLYRMSLETFFNADNACIYEFEESIAVPCNASFCQYDNGILWVGEFERTTSNPKDKQYKTDPSHHIKVNGGKNTGWILGYVLDGSTQNEIKASKMTGAGAVPDYILSTTEKIQGVTLGNGSIYLSQSFGRTKDSTIYRHKNVLQNAPNAQVNVLGSTAPIWYLDSSSETGKLKAPPMTENLCTIGGKVYVSFESGAAFYRIPTDPDNSTPAKDPVDRIFRLDAF